MTLASQDGLVHVHRAARKLGITVQSVRRLGHQKRLELVDVRSPGTHEARYRVTAASLDREFSTRRRPGPKRGPRT
jgi:hypothetical protein